MANEDNSVVNPIDFMRLEEHVNFLRNDVSRLTETITPLTKLEPLLHRMLSSEKVEKLETDVDVAHGEIRDLKAGHRGLRFTLYIAVTITIFFLGSIQGIFFWEANHYINQADHDHDLLMKTVVQLNQLETDYYYAKRHPASRSFNSPRNSGESLHENQGLGFPAGTVLQDFRTSVEKQCPRLQLYSGRRVYLSKDIQPSF